MLHSRFLEHLQQRFTDFFSDAISVHNYFPVYGGDINQVFMLETGKGNFLIKLNASLFGLVMFENEARGLITLADKGCIKVPRPLFDGKFHQQIFLVMEYIEKGNPVDNFWNDFGERLACLHHQTGVRHGLGYPNYIGKLVQPNFEHDKWPDFYTNERILPLAVKALSKGLLEAEQMTEIEKLSAKFSEIYPEEKPSLLHGDLWSGNFMVASNGLAVVFDPAIYYGNREMDIAMSLLFGGFDKKFYESYQYHFPMQQGWEQRVELCQLYPLLVHLILFGGHYHQQVMDIIKKYK